MYWPVRTPSADRLAAESVSTVREEGLQQQLAGILVRKALLIAAAQAAIGSIDAALQAG